MSEYLYKKKTPCRHEYARSDGNPDWPGFVCAKCGIPVKGEHYESKPIRVDNPLTDE